MKVDYFIRLSKPWRLTKPGRVPDRVLSDFPVLL